MQVHSSVSRISRILFAFLLVAGSVALVGSNKPSSPGQNPWRDKALVDFVNPGLNITINSAAISSAGVITVTYTLTDPTGLPLDASGTTTPGPISLAYVAAYIPKGQEQYVAYTTASATGAVLGTIIRPDFEVFTAPAAQVGPGQYTYTFIAKAPAGFDPTVTTTVAVDGNRDQTAFDLGTSYAGATFNFVPNGSPVTVTRDVIRTESCNTCHYQLAFHGGYASGMPMCVMCHQPQNADPATGNTLDLKVFAHKLHMGSQLPSVLGYTSGTTKVPPAPYEIIGYMNSVNNFSTVIDPAMPQRCEVCHSQTTGAAQAKAFLTEPTARRLRRLPRRCQFRHRRQPPRRYSRRTTPSAPTATSRKVRRPSMLPSWARTWCHRHRRYLPAEPGYADRRPATRHYRCDQHHRRAESHGRFHRAGQQQ